MITVLNGCDVEVVEEKQRSIMEDGSIVMGEMMCLSMNSFLGLKSPTTTKIKGSLGKFNIVVMLDSGATHNFISPQLVKRAKLKVQQETGCDIKLGTGVTVQSVGICKQVIFQVSGMEFVSDIITLELGGADIILGVQWLRTLGTCQVNWETHEWKFVYKGTKVTLHGDPTLHHSHFSLKSLSLEMMIQQKGVELQLCNTEMVKEIKDETPVLIQSVLQEFQQVFAKPTGLPPIRGSEHAIRLCEGSGPICVRPYRYPHAHKEEMEKLVKTMLETGIIRPSRSPFSSPVLLVKKKDNSWRFCVDYRAVNRATIPDKFPIPLIDQLLDELYGAVIFTKLDLRAGYH